MELADTDMIIHKLIALHLGKGDFEKFYLLQAQEAIRWMTRRGPAVGPGVSALDLGCGHGVFGAELLRLGCQVTFADEGNYLFPDIASAPFLKINLDREDPGTLGAYDLVVCSNVLEHLAAPGRLIRGMRRMVRPGGWFYLSWTNWLSPWGGHEFSPFHYLGSRRGHLLYDRFVGKKRNHTPYQNLFPTHIGRVLRELRAESGLEVVTAAPRYYAEFPWILSIPVLREFLTWNCAVLLRRGEDEAAVLENEP